MLAFFVLRWARGLLPIAAALAILLLIIAVIAGHRAGRHELVRPQPRGVRRAAQSLFGGKGLSDQRARQRTVLLIPVEVALIVFAMIGFSPGLERRDRGDRGGGAAPRLQAGRRAAPPPPRPSAPLTRLTYGGWDSNPHVPKDNGF